MINFIIYSVKPSSKTTQSSLIGDTVHNTGISLAYSYRQVCGFF